MHLLSPIGFEVELALSLSSPPVNCTNSFAFIMGPLLQSVMVFCMTMLRVVAGRTNRLMIACVLPRAVSAGGLRSVKLSPLLRPAGGFSTGPNAADSN